MLLALALIFTASACRTPASHAAQTPSRAQRSPPAVAARVRTRRARVLLVGDSILDQEGSAAAFLLRQADVDAQAIAVWGSGVIGTDQYDYGKTKPSGYWLHRARNLIASFDPDVVGVYMNHSYWPPYPHDAAGRPITDLWSASGQRMIGQQARALITILRARGARVFFISPIPAGEISNPDPAAWNPIWHGYLPALRAMHVAIAHTSGPIAAASGLRAETKRSCRSMPQRVRPPGDVHLTRFGAGLTGTSLAEYVAGLVHANLRGNAAPGDAAAALVPTRDGRGYWLVGCDGSVYRFGDAKPLAGRRATMLGHGGVAGAAATPSGRGLWLVAADGTIATAGDATPLAFAPRPRDRIVAATGVPGGSGLWGVTAEGAVAVAGSAHVYRALGGVRTDGGIVGIAATRGGRGYWLVGRDGGVFAFGDARRYGSEARSSAHGAVAGLAPTGDDRGYWLIDTDGTVLAFGDAHLHGSGVWQRPTGPHGADVAVPGPTIGIAASPRVAQGYWIFGTTGRVVGRGAAGHYGGDNNLALDTQ